MSIKILHSNRNIPPNVRKANGAVEKYFRRERETLYLKLIPGR